MANDPYWNSVVLAMHMDDTGLTDLKGHAVTLNGNAARSAAQSKFGGYSAYFDGNNDYLSLASSIDWAFGTSDFTIEFWLYRSGDTTVSAASAGIILDLRTAEPSAQIELHLTGSTATSPQRVVLYINGSDRLVSTSQVTTDFTHVALVRSSGVTKLYINGVSEGGTYSDTNSYTAAALAIGGRFAAVSTDYRSLNGYIDDLRITKGVARYTTDFTVPTEAFPNTPPQLSGTVTDANNNPVSRPVIAVCRNRASFVSAGISDATTGAFALPAYDGSAHSVIALPVEGDPYWDQVVLAMHMDGTNGSTTFTDAKGKTVTAYGNARISTEQSKFGGASVAFDGAGDYLAIPASTDIDFGSYDFTIELWYRVGSISVAQHIITRKSAANASDGFILAQPSGDPTKIIFLAGDSSTTAFEVSITSTTSLVVGVWYHVVVTRSGGIFRLFINGVCQAVRGWGGIIHYASTPTYVGISYDLSTGSVNGYVDDLRITNGVARYIHDFTPPSSPFPHAITGGAKNALVLDNITPV